MKLKSLTLTPSTLQITKINKIYAQALIKLKFIKGGAAYTCNFEFTYTQKIHTRNKQIKSK